MIALVLLAPFLAGQTIATGSVTLLSSDLSTSTNAFIPGTTSSCPENWPSCGSSGTCYNPDEGQTCCPGGTYACPSSFCLHDPYCCPNDQSPDSCASEYGIALTTSALSSQTQLFPTDEVTTDPQYHPRPIVLPTSASSITISSTPIPTSSTGPWPSLSVTISSRPSSEEDPAYTGAGWRLTSGGDGKLGTLAVVIAVLGCAI
ncbi:hypothetical protein BJX76DRAFT_320805 [Aspergillus varians]